MMLMLFATVYTTVLITELIGDKTLYTISALVVRYQSAPIFAGVVIAFMGKVLAAVLLGKIIALLPVVMVTTITTVTFFVTALTIWLRQPESKAQAPSRRVPTSTALLVGFAAIFFTEWGDIGQITTASFVARYHAPLTVWMAGTLALTTKGALALAIGSQLRRYVPRQTLRYGAVGMCVVLGIIAAFHVDG